MNLKSTRNKLITLGILIVVIGTGAYTLYKTTWMFTPVYSQRQTTKQFIADLAANKTAAAYQLTSSKYQAATSYQTFLTQVNKIDNHKLSTKFVAYTVQSDKTVTITGYVTDATTVNKMSLFMGLEPTKTNSIDSIILIKS